MQCPHFDLLNRVDVRGEGKSLVAVVRVCILGLMSPSLQYHSGEGTARMQKKFLGQLTTAPGTKLSIACSFTLSPPKPRRCDLTSMVNHQLHPYMQLARFSPLHTKT
jgi:hypothetical protein